MKRLALAALLALAAPSGAFAHHGQATNRLGPDPGGGRLVWSDAPPPRVLVTAGYDHTHFSRARQGAGAYARADLGRVSVDTLTLAANVELASRTRFVLQLPVGLTTVRPARAAAQTAAGLGDLTLGVAQPWSLGGPWRLQAEAGLVLPTGRYANDAALSLTDVSGVSDGGVDLVTYDTRASLGAGTWSPYADLTAGARVGRWAGAVGVTVQAPLTRTSDDIRWGYDVETRVSGQVGVWRAGRFGVTVGAGVDYRRHGRDDVPNLETGETEATGGRHDVGARLRVQVDLPGQVWCAAQARLPVWQYAGGVQLMETVSAGATCAVSVGL